MSQDQNPPNDETPNTPPAPTIPDADEITKIRKEANDFRKQAADLQKKIDDMKIAGHKDKNDWKTVAEAHEQKAKEYEQKFTGLQAALVNEKKIAALTIEAQKAGINPASLPDLELLDFDEISVETTSTGKILVSGQDKAIAKLKILRPHWFTKQIPGVNPSTPETGNKTGLVTIEDLEAARAQYAKTQSEADKNKYFDLIKKYKAQGG